MYERITHCDEKTEKGLLARNRRYRERNIELCRERTRIARRKRREAEPAKIRELDRNHHARIRLQAIMLLGGRCNHCGITDSRVLQIDHVYGGGTQENKRVHSRGVATRAMQEPDKYQLLCANCNWIKRHERNENKQRKDVSGELSPALGDSAETTKSTESKVA